MKKVFVIATFCFGLLLAQSIGPVSVRIVDETIWYRKPENWIAISTGGIALIALCVAGWQAYLQRKSVELSTFEGVFRDIRDADKAYKEKYEIPLQEALDRSQPQNDAQVGNICESYDRALNVTAPPFFNTVEYMAFLINHGYITDKVLTGYFDDVLGGWLERLDGHTRTEEWAKNQSFKEFRKLCRDRKP
jgi:hypothetical protein